MGEKSTVKVPEGYERSLSLKAGDKVLVSGEYVVGDNGTGTIHSDPRPNAVVIMVILDEGKRQVYINPKNIYKKRKESKGTAVTTTEAPVVIPKGFKPTETFYMNSVVLILPHGQWRLATQGKIEKWHNASSTEVEVVVAGSKFMVQSKYLASKDHNYQEPGPLFKDLKDPTEDHLYMAELLYAPTMDETILLGLKGVDLKNYRMIRSKTGSKWCAIIPKDAKGPMPVLMAHSDIQANVKHPTVDNLEYNPKDGKYSSPRGLGADDRAGIFVMNKALQAHEGKFIVMFFDEEEIGCKGSGNFITSDTFKKEVEPLASCFISIDRARNRVNGKKHIATYGYDNKELLKLCKDKLGRDDQRGSSTDCKVLSRASETMAKTTGGVSCMNFSCGYINEHTSSEALYHAELLETAEDVCKLVTEIPELWTKRFLAPKSTTTSYGYGYNSRQRNTGYGYGGGYGTDEMITYDGELYDESDVENLAKAFLYYTGKAYIPSKPTQIKLPKVHDLVNLRDEVSAGGIFGGKALNLPTVTMLKANLWVVVSVDEKTMTAALTTDDGQIDATNIPLAALVGVSTNDPLVTYDLL